LVLKVRVLLVKLVSYSLYPTGSREIGTNIDRQETLSLNLCKIRTYEIKIIKKMVPASEPFLPLGTILGTILKH